MKKGRTVVVVCVFLCAEGNWGKDLEGETGRNAIAKPASSEMNKNRYFLGQSGISGSRARMPV